MSVGLKTKLNCRIEIRDLILDTSQILQELLNVSVTPLIRAEEFRDGHWRSLGLASDQLSLTSATLGAEHQT